MVDSRALQSEYVWTQTVADRKCTYGAYSYAPKWKGTFPPSMGNGIR